MDIVKTITTKIRRHNFTFREGRRIYYGLQMDTTRLVWKAGRSTSTGGGSPSIASFGKSRSAMAKSSTTDTLRRTGQPLFFTMRTIEVTVMKTVVFITDWNHATWRLFKETDGMFRCTLPDRTTQIRVATFYEFLTTLFGQRQIGAFSNYEVKIKGNGQ